MLAVIPLLGLTAFGKNTALAWDGQEWNGLGCGDGCGFHHWNFGGGCCDNQGGCCGIHQNGPCCGDNVQTNSCCDQGTEGFSDGVSDAVYDHQNNLAYNPIGSCIPCHSQDYWNNFHQGYDDKWNSFWVRPEY